MSKQPDITKLRKAVKNFSFYSSPSSANSSEPCTVGDVKKVIANVSKLFNTFIDELE